MAMAGGNSNEEVMGDINITPLTDVLLVLLIIFMIASTAIAQTGFNIRLPKVVSKEEANPSQIIVSIDTRGSVFVGANRVDYPALQPYLAKLATARRSNRVIIKADESVLYGVVIRVMDAAKTAGLHEIALATERSTGNR